MPKILGLAVTAIGAVVLATLAVMGVVKHCARVPVSNSRGAQVSATTSTLADVRIQAAEQLIQKAPFKPDGYNRLAAAFMQKARETNDFGFNARAEAALGRSLELAADNYDAIKLRAKLLLTYHRFSEALDVTRHARPQQAAPTLSLRWQKPAALPDAADKERQLREVNENQRAR